MAKQNPSDDRNHLPLFSSKKTLNFLSFFAVILLSFFFLLGSASLKSANAAGITFVQAAAASPTTKATSEKITFSKAVQNGDLLVGWFAQKNATGQVSVSDNVNGAWTRGPSEEFTNGSGDIALYYKANSKASS